MKIKCTHCNIILEGDKKGTYIQCKCGKCAIDETLYYCRIIGNREDFEEIEELTPRQKDVLNAIKDITGNATLNLNELLEILGEKENE